MDRQPGLVGNAAYASVAGLSMLLLAVLLVIAGRLLGEEEYGKFSFALALAMIFETVIDFGLKEITTREVARNRRAAQALVAPDVRSEAGARGGSVGRLGARGEPPAPGAGRPVGLLSPGSGVHPAILPAHCSIHPSGGSNGSISTASS